MNDLARYLDHTLLKADATPEEIVTLCTEAKQYIFASVCVNSCHVPLAAAELEGSSVAVCTVVGFPLGAMQTASKAFETKKAIAEGADEVDMVLNIGWLKAGEPERVKNDIAEVKKACGNKLLKVILETALLDQEEIVLACTLALEAGADFVKTSTGFSTGGATIEDVRLMKQTVGDRMQVKASGGIRDTETARAMISVGASRLGVSAGVAIVEGSKPHTQGGY